MPKQPWIKFWPADWLADPAVRACSFAARGLWIDMLCIMHESPRKGYLIVGSSPLQHVEIARIFGEHPHHIKSLLTELEKRAYSVATKTELSIHGAWLEIRSGQTYTPQMVSKGASN